jgi:ParB-like nuclease domain
MMKLQNVKLDDIVANPWRDTTLYPLDKEHIAELRDSIDDHGFFGGVKGRRVNGKIELGCGHARIEAARKAKLETLPIFIDDLDDDQMLQLMTDENATQAGANPGAVLNEVAAVTRRLIEGLLGPSDNCPKQIAQLFKGKGIEQTRGALRVGNNVHRTLGVDVIRAYLGQGKPERAHRGERQIREAINALKQSGRYDELIDEELRKHPLPVPDAKESKSTTVAKTKPRARRPRLLDERCAHVFPNEHQFQAFREAVTTPAAQKVLPVSSQFALAKEIINAPVDERPKQIGASYIKMKVQEQVQLGLKAQREIDHEERENYLAEQVEARIDLALNKSNGFLRAFFSSLARLIELADEFPHDPKLGGFGLRLNDLVKVIQQFNKKLAR